MKNSKNYKWAVVGMLWFICFFNYADRQAIFSVFPKLKTEFGFGPVQLGLIGSAFAWVYAAGAPWRASLPTGSHVKSSSWVGACFGVW